MITGSIFLSMFLKNVLIGRWTSTCLLSLHGNQAFHLVGPFSSPCWATCSLRTPLSSVIRLPPFQRGFKFFPDLQVDILICILSSPLPGGILDSLSGGRADLSRSQWLKAADFLAPFFLLDEILGFLFRFPILSCISGY